jgi:hypothetical protein
MHSENRLSHALSFAQISTSFAQAAPENPAVQLHTYALTWSVHVALFMHGVDVQSSLSIWQLYPL